VLALMNEADMSTGPSDMEAPPVIIWTFRRTGGTSLRGILFWLTKRGSFQDEAFNDRPERELGSITSKFRDDNDDEDLRESVRTVMSARRNLKHCIENVPFRLNSVLIEETIKLGYRHVILLRLNEIDRQVSLEMARSTGAWGPTEASSIYADIREGRREMPALNIGLMRRQTESDAAALGKLLRLFMLARQEPLKVFFEDLYLGSMTERCDAFRRVAQGVGVPGASNLGDTVFENAATKLGQDSGSMRSFVPNLSEAISELGDIVK
jgi:hypothetical protein